MGTHRKGSLRGLGLAVVFTFALSVGLRAGAKDKRDGPPEIDKSMPVNQARQQIASAMNTIYDWDGGITYGEVHVTDQEFDYLVSVTRGGFAGMSAARIATDGRPGKRIYSFKDTPFLDPPEHHLGAGWCVRSSLDLYKKDNLCWKDRDDAKAKASAEQFVKAMNRMIWENSLEGKSQREVQQQTFQQQFAAWRANGSKVEVPEQAQRHFVLAQQAFQEKDFQHQAEELSAALEIYPTWPAEQYDLAVILGELNRYSEAIRHAEMYLQLAPDAPDAERVKQQIWIWQDKVAHEQTAPQPPAQTPQSAPQKTHGFGAR
jgi:hypothetical protein